MSDERKKPCAAFWITVALIAVLVGYPLSIGPAVLIAGQRLPSDTLRSAYRPIGRVYWRVPVLRGAMDTYVRFWGVRCWKRYFWEWVDYDGSIHEDNRFSFQPHRSRAVEKNGQNNPQ
jgi:hypothetical protein